MKKNIVQLLKDNTFIITMLPIIAYTLAFIYESGYCEYFQIPTEFITISINNLIISLSYLFLFIFLYLVFLYMKEDNTMFIFMKWCINIFLYTFPFFLVLFILIGYISFYFAYVFSLFITIISILLYIMGLVKKEKFEPNKLEIKEFLIDSSISIYKLFFFIVLISFFAYSLGFFNAKNKTFFYTNSKQKYIFLKKYGDYVILKKYDTEYLANGIKVFNVNSTTNLELKYKEMELKYKDTYNEKHYLLKFFSNSKGQAPSKVLDTKINNLIQNLKSNF